MYIKFIYFITIISLEWSLTSIPYFFVCANTNILILLGLIQSSLFYVYSYKWNNLIIFLWTMYKQILLIINFQLVHIRFWRTFLILMYVLSLNLPCLLCFFFLIYPYEPIFFTCIPIWNSETRLLFVKK